MVDWGKFKPGRAQVKVSFPAVDFHASHPDRASRSRTTPISPEGVTIDERLHHDQALVDVELADLVERLHADLYRAAAAAGIDVSTMVFVHPVDRPRVDRLGHAVEAAGAKLTYVQLRPSRPVLEQRVEDVSIGHPGRSRTSPCSDG